MSIRPKKETVDSVPADQNQESRTLFDDAEMLSYREKQEAINRDFESRISRLTGYSDFFFKLLGPTVAIITAIISLVLHFIPTR